MISLPQKIQYEDEMQGPIEWGHLIFSKKNPTSESAFPDFWRMGVSLDFWGGGVNNNNKTKECSHLNNKTRQLFCRHGSLNFGFSYAAGSCSRSYS